MCAYSEDGLTLLFVSRITGRPCSAAHVLIARTRQECAQTPAHWCLGAGSRGVHQYYLADDIAVYETMINAKTISTHVVRRMCDGDRPTHSSCPWAENVSPWLPDVSNTCSGTSSASCCWLGVQAFGRSGDWYRGITGIGCSLDRYQWYHRFQRYQRLLRPIASRV
jgi:hypothetical protein